jgi:hypothetical protein
LRLQFVCAHNTVILMFLNSILFEVAKYAERKEFGMISVDENDKRDKISITFNQKKLFLYRNRSQLFKRTYANCFGCELSH